LRRTKEEAMDLERQLAELGSSDEEESSDEETEKGCADQETDVTDNEKCADEKTGETDVEKPAADDKTDEADDEKRAAEETEDTDDDGCDDEKTDESDKTPAAKAGPPDEEFACSLRQMIRRDIVAAINGLKEEIRQSRTGSAVARCARQSAALRGHDHAAEDLGDELNSRVAALWKQLGELQRKRKFAAKQHHAKKLYERKEFFAEGRAPLIEPMPRQASGCDSNR